MNQQLFETDMKMLMVRHGLTEIAGVVDIEDRQTAVIRYSLSESPSPAYDVIREALEGLVNHIENQP